MRFASTAWRSAGWRLPPLAKTPQASPATAERSHTAGDLAPATHEVRIAGFGLLTSSPIAALRTGAKALSGILQFPSFDDPTAQTDYVRVTSCLDAIHHGIDNGPTCFDGVFRRQQGARPRRRRASAGPGRSFAGGPRSLTRRS